LVNLDARLGELFDAFGGLERMLAQLCVIMTADHSISDVGEDETSAGIQLNELLKEYSITDAGQKWSGEDQIKACPNLRAAHIYFRHPAAGRRDEVTRQLLTDPRIDQVIYRKDLTPGQKPGYCVTTQDRGELHFWRGDAEERTAQDSQGQRWSWDGDLRAVDGQVSDDNSISFTNYPQAFERIAGLLDFPDSGDLILTARPSYEFQLPRTSVHTGGGSHGSLHSLDSLVPLLLAGVPEGIEPPYHPRTVDVVPLCLSVLGIDTQPDH
jgi:hypothetical protein